MRRYLLRSLLDAVLFVLVFGEQAAVEDTLEGSVRLVLRLLQVLQVIVGLTHPGFLPLLPPPEEHPGTFVEEAA